MSEDSSKDNKIISTKNKCMYEIHIEWGGE